MADFAILDQDFFSVPVDQIGRTTSLLTVVGGKVVHAAGALAAAGLRWRGRVDLQVVALSSGKTRGRCIGASIIAASHGDTASSSPKGPSEVALKGKFR